MFARVYHEDTKCFFAEVTPFSSRKLKEEFKKRLKEGAKAKEELEERQKKPDYKTRWDFDYDMFVVQYRRNEKSEFPGLSRLVENITDEYAARYAKTPLEFMVIKMRALKRVWR